MKEIVFELPKTHVYAHKIDDKAHVGIIDKHGDKAYVVYTGAGYYQIVSAIESPGVCNSLFVGHAAYKSVYLAIKAHKSFIKQMVQFDSRKELFLWLAL